MDLLIQTWQVTDDLLIHLEQSIMWTVTWELFEGDSDQNFNELFSTQKVRAGRLPYLVMRNVQVVRNEVKNGVLIILLSIFDRQVCVKATLLVNKDGQGRMVYPCSII